MDKTSKMNKLITIYTQAYNVEPYIEQCINSVISQTYCNFEWLLIENGSTDGTKEIIRKYEQLDSRIKVDYFKQNKTGFAGDYIRENTNGEYIVRIDSDDWIERDYLEKLFYQMETQNADISICGALDYEEETSEEFPHEYGHLEGVYTLQDINSHFIEMRSYMGTYWGKLFRKSIFFKTLIKMEEVYEKLKQASFFGGDTAFMLYYLLECKKLVFIDKRMYHYRIHGKSYTANTIGINRISNYFVLMGIEKEFLRKCNAQTAENNILVELSFWTSLEKLLKGIINSELPLEEKLKKIQEIYTDPRIQQFRKESDNSKVRKILSTYAAWYFVNMSDRNKMGLRDLLDLLEPEIFGRITEKTYEWMSYQSELMAYMLMGEYDGAQKYMVQIATENNKIPISELQKTLDVRKALGVNVKN